MQNYHTWLLDLDDTLQIGPLSWANIHLFPALIAQTGIQPDNATYDAAYLRAEELYRAGGSNDVLGDEFFRMMGWSPDLKTEVLERFQREYQPALFEDTLPFLAWAKGRGDRLYIMSNNTWARGVCKMLGLTSYFAEIVNPADSGVTGKPTPAMWDYLRERAGLNESASTVIVGNSLATDGVFARNCGLDCIILDRYDRFGAMPERCVRVASLVEIMGQVG